MPRDPSHNSDPTASPLRDATHGIRLQKALANAGVASRRACEELIAEGRVRVNGTTVTELPAWVDPATDRIEVDGKLIARPRKTRGKHTPDAVGKTYLLVNKPRGVISTNDDPEGRPRVIDLPDKALVGRARLFPVGRLDADSTGLILLTDDGELAHRLTHPSFGITKTYRVTIKGKPSEADLARLRKGLLLTHDKKTKRVADDEQAKTVKRAKPQAVTVLKSSTDRARSDRTLLKITLAEGQNREIRRLLARLGFKVTKLHRTAMGPLQLKAVPRSGARPLSITELGKLRRACGLV
ncbi:MAG: pseudouridine synthase [Planctomycetota bacterium]